MKREHVAPIKTAQDGHVDVNAGAARWWRAPGLTLVIILVFTLAGTRALLPPGVDLVLAQSEPTPRSLPTVPPTATATPRVIVIDRPAPSPSSVPPAPTTPPTATATPVSRVIPPPPPTATPFVIPTPFPTPTATPRPPEPTPALPSATPAPRAAAAVPTIAPAPIERISFAAEDWRGGFYRGDSLAYGRPWVAVYGASSEYPSAALFFSLDEEPVGTAFITLAGLDDEWAANNEIAIEVNGERIFSGPSPFANWDGIGDGANAAWTNISFTIPPRLLRAGPNEIQVANLTPGSSFDAPPYLLVAEATLQIRKTAGRPAPGAAPPLLSSAAFSAEAWRGGYYRGDGEAYGRPWVALYGAQSAYARSTLVFRLTATPDGPAIFRLTGLDDELPTRNPIAVEVNGRQVFSGPSPFANWDGLGNGADAAWTEATFSIPVDALRSGRNEIAVANLTPVNSFNGPPYVLLADAVVEVTGAEIEARAPDR